MGEEVTLEACLIRFPESNLWRGIVCALILCGLCPNRGAGIQARSQGLGQDAQAHGR